LEALLISEYIKHTHTHIYRPIVVTRHIIPWWWSQWRYPKHWLNTCMLHYAKCSFLSRKCSTSWIGVR